MTAFEEGFIALLEMTIRASVLIGLVMVIRLLFRRHLPASTMFTMWILLAGVLLMPWRASVPWSRLAWTMPAHSPKLSPAMAALTAEAMERTEAGNVSIPYRLPSPDPEVMAEFKRRFMAFDFLGVSISTERYYVRFLMLIWAAGVVSLVVMRLLALGQFYWKLSRTALGSDPRLQQAVEAGIERWRLKRVPQVVTTRLVGGPALSGIIRPQLLVPPDFAQKLSDEELHWVVEHELAHLRRRDLWAQALWQAAGVVHWFNPLVWLAARLARRDCELACDAFVLRHAMPEERENYGCALLKVMGVVSGRSRVPAALGIFENKRQLRRRIGMIADHRMMSWQRSVAGILLLGAFVMAGYTREATENAVGKTHAEPQAPAAARPGEFHPTIMPAQSPETIAQRKAREKEREAWESKVEFELRVVGAIGGAPVAIIDLNGQPQAVKVRSELLRWSVDRIDPQKKTVVLTKAGQSARELPLTNPSKAGLLKIEEANRFLQMNEANRGLLIKNSLRRFREYPLIPREVEAAWGHMSRDAKEAILINFLRNGIVMNRFIEPSGNGGGSASLLFGAEISEMRREGRERFLNSLTSEQRKKYHGGAMLAIKFTAPPEEQRKQYERSQAVEKDKGEVVASLTTEQRELYDAWEATLDDARPAKRL